MATEIKVPPLGESIAEATVSKWLKRPGEAVALEEPVAELETDKVTLEIPAPAAGTLAEILAAEGANVSIGAVLGRIADGPAATPHPAADMGPSLSPLAPAPPSPASGEGLGRGRSEGDGQQAPQRSGPAARKLIEENGFVTAAI